jgi:hypothetical protein
MSAETSTVSPDSTDDNTESDAALKAFGCLKMAVVMVSAFRETIEDPSLRVSFGQAEDMMAMAVVQFNERLKPSEFKTLRERSEERLALERAATANN